MKDNVESINSEPVERKAYTTPAIVHELKLETRAGTPDPGRPPNLVDPLGLDPTQPQAY